jgi:hypothetical protein
VSEFKVGDKVRLREHPDMIGTVNCVVDYEYEADSIFVCFPCFSGSVDTPPPALEHVPKAMPEFKRRMVVEFHNSALAVINVSSEAWNLTSDGSGIVALYAPGEKIWSRESEK